MAVLLHGAIKNVGDFLIRERGVRLLAHARPDLEVVEQFRRLPLEPGAAPVVLCGGPGLQAGFHPDVFALVDDLDALPPTYTLALGWGGQPVDDPSAFRFTEQSAAALRAISSHGWLSVRDDLTLAVVEQAGVGEVRRTGCVAWYDVDSLGKPPHRPVSVEQVVVTMPAQPRNTRQAAQVLRMVKARFPSARRFCVFHRGIASRGNTSSRVTASNVALAAAARATGYRVVDAAGSLDRIEFYRSADLHVGYRVHAHLAFLSYRRPSVLVSEDGRGVGQAATLQDPYRLRASEVDLVDRLGDAIDREVASGDGTAAAVGEIEATWPVMRAALEQIR